MHGSELLRHGITKAQHMNWSEAWERKREGCRYSYYISETGRRGLWQPESRINQQVVGEKMKKRCAQASMVKQHAKCLSVCTAVNFWDCDVPLYRCGTYGYAVTYSTINQQVVGEKMKFCEFKCNPQGWGDQSYFTFDDSEFLSRRGCKKFWDCDMPLYTLCRRDLWQPESRINQQVVGKKNEETVRTSFHG